MMIHHDTHDDTPGRSKLSKEDILWIASGVVISLTLLAIIYFGLTLIAAY